MAETLNTAPVSGTEMEIVNKVAQSGLVQIDLEEWYPEGVRTLLDIAPQLWQGLILKEKDFRQWIKEHDWQAYGGHHVAITCSADAIVPTWAFMLVATKLAGVAETVTFGSLEDLEATLFRRLIEQLNVDDYRGAKVVVKGCSNKPVPLAAYVALTAHLAPVVASLMFGEPCSTVPLMKNIPPRVAIPKG